MSAALDRLIDWQVEVSIKKDAEIRAHHWAENFFKTTPSARKIVEFGVTTQYEYKQIQNSFGLLDVVRFQMFNRQGMQKFLSGSGILAPTTVFNADAFQVSETGVPIVRIHEHGDHHDHKEHDETYVEVYLPAVLSTGETIGTFEIYVDISEFEDALEVVFRQTSRYVIAGTLLVLMLPVTAYVLRTRQLMRQDKKLLELKRYDQLTGILNRNSVTDYLDHQFEEGNSPDNLGILFIDVDYFKQVNDQYGHACGDTLLRHIAALLTTAADASEKAHTGEHIVGRYGGDEFVVLAPGISLEGLRALYGHIMDSARSPCIHEGNSYIPSLSVGAYLTQPGDTEKDAIHRADLAVYSAKRRGRSQVVEYSEDLEGLFSSENAQQSA